MVGNHRRSKIPHIFLRSSRRSTSESVKDSLDEQPDCCIPLDERKVDQAQFCSYCSGIVHVLLAVIH